MCFISYSNQLRICSLFHPVYWNFLTRLIACRESPQTFHFLESQSNVPLKHDIKPTVTLLSRKPQPSRTPATVNSTATGMARLAVATEDNNPESSEEEEEKKKPPEPTPEERQAMALRNLEERQRKYEEVRERLFGSPSANTSGMPSPRSGTSPNKQNEGRGKGRGRGGGKDNQRDKRDSSSTSSKSRQLYDPGNPSKSNSNYVHKKESQSPNEKTGNGQQQSPRQPIRHPRGPDANGRGGFRSSSRGSKAT